MAVLDPRCLTDVPTHICDISLLASVGIDYLAVFFPLAVTFQQAVSKCDEFPLDTMAGSPVTDIPPLWASSMAILLL